MNIEQTISVYFRHCEEGARPDACPELSSCEVPVRPERSRRERPRNDDGRESDTL